MSTNVYDADNRLIAVTDALGHTTTYGYDNNGNRTTVTDPLGRTTTYGFDQQNRLVTVTDPLTGVTTYAYDQASRQISITDADGNTTTNTYDNANRLTSVTDPNSHVTSYAYDNANRLTSVTDRNNRQTTYSYDLANNKTGETWVGGSYTATYGYDSANRLTSETDNFSSYALGYDNANRLTSVDNNGTPNDPRVILTYGYDAFNNRTSIADNSGATESLTYDSDNNLTNVSLSKSSWSNTNTLTLAYDSANRLTSLGRQWGNKNLGFTQVNTTYGYDNADRLTGITHGSLMTLTYGYDQANQLTTYAGPDGSITYGYDNDGQLTGATGAHNETYTYDKEGNRTMTGYVTSIGNRLTSDGTYSYTYDQDGNMLTQTRISDGQVTSYTWDFRNRLTEVLIKTSGGTTVQDDKFTYDIENRRIGRNTLSGGQSWTAYVDSNPFMDFNSSGSLLYRYIYGNAIDSLLGRIDTSGNAMWYLTDKLGSVRENTDGNRNVLDSITYDTYGNIIAENHPASGDRFKYTSREWDSEIGQYFYRARYYSATDGRFESEDPEGFTAGDTDFYRYVKNSPTNANDPTGLANAKPPKIIATNKSNSLHWDGTITAYLTVWDNGDFEINLVWDSWNGRECDNLGEGHILGAFGADFERPKPSGYNAGAGGDWFNPVPQSWKWTTTAPDRVFVNDGGRRIKTFHKILGAGIEEACSGVSWMIWGNAPKDFKDEVTLRIKRLYLSSDTNIPSQTIITPERLKIDYSINGSDTTIQLSGDAVPAVILPPKPQGKPQGS